MAELLAEIFLGPIVETLISKITSPIKEEFGLLQGLKTEVEKLKSKLTSIQATLQDAEEKQLQNPSLRDWLDKLRNAILDAEDVLETLATKRALSRRMQKVRKVSYQHDAAHKIKNILKRIDEIAKEKKKFHLKNSSDGGSSQEQPQTFDSEDTMDVCGRDIDKENIKKLLLSDEEDEMSIIPIIGMPGLGKTTLALLLFNDEQVKERFERRMWASVSVNFDLTRILREIIEYHSKMKYPTDLSLNQLKSRLLHILDGNPFLLVLDNVWNEDYSEWEPLEKILKQGSKKSKIIVTSRSTKVAEIMGTRPPYVPELLPEGQCWSLFEKIAFNHSNASKRLHLEDIGREIVRKCKGLPLAVKAMAGLLRGGDDVNKWQNILHSHVWELEDRESHTNTPKILCVLKLSYDHLRPRLKQCFAYCCIFPKSYFFHKEELVKFWIAQGFIHSKEKEKQEEIGNGYFDELVMRSFFQLSDTEKARYQMHDVMHDLAHLVSSPHSCQMKDSKSCSAKETRHLSLLCEDVDQPVLSIVENSQKLRTLLFSGECLKTFGAQTLGKIFHELKYLRMLDLSNSTLSELPSAVEKLKLLRYLDLSRTEIKVLPNSIGNLYNLQTLKLLGSLWLFKLPDGLSNLVNLRNLELDDIFWFKSSTLPPRIGNLTSLRNLHAFQIGHKSGYGIEELKNMAYLTGTLHISKLENAANAKDAKLNEKENLEKLVFEWSSRDVNPQDIPDEEKLLEDLQPHSDIRELHIFNYMGTRFPNWITGGLQNLLTLTLKGCTKCKILSLGQVPNLRELHIKGMKELEKWSDETCMSLSRLKISCCEKLNVLPEYFLYLQVMKIRKCSSLKSLPVTPSLNSLILVDNPVLEDLNECLHAVKIVTGSDQGHNRTEEDLPSFLQLLDMKISNCPKLQALPHFFAPQKLEISECELLSTLITVPDLRQYLQHLALDKCRDETLVRAIPDTNSLYSLIISNISNLNSFPRWPNLPGLKVLYITCCNDLVSLSGEGSLISFASLELLSIRGCSKLETFPDEGLPTALKCLIIASCSSLKSLGTNGTLKSLNSLKDLYIEDCPMLQSFPEDGLPTSLRHLHIQNCPSLTEQCGTEDVKGPEWPKISHIPDLEIDFIRSTHLSNKIVPSATRRLPFCCRAGFDISDIRQLEQQPDAQSLTARKKVFAGLKWKGKIEQGESSTSAQ